MFEAMDTSNAAAAMNEDAVHELLDPSADAGIISKGRCDEICREIGEALRFIRESPLKDDPFWVEFQKMFGFAGAPDRVTPMNAANLCPEPTYLLNAANGLRLDYNKNVSQQIRMAGGARVEQLRKTRELLAAGLGLTGTEGINSIALVRNASEANNAVNCGYRKWASGPGVKKDNVVLWSENHPTNLTAWYLRSEWPGTNALFEIKPPVTFDFKAPDAAILDAFTSKIDKSTRFVSYSYISNASGFRIPDAVIKGIFAHATQPGYDCHVHIDGTMAWGARHVNLASPYCHSFVSSAHKWMLGPKETGLLWMTKDKVKNFVPSIFAYDYQIDIPNPWSKMPDTALRFELIGQRDDVNLITLALTQMLWTALSPRKPYDRVKALADRLVAELKQSGERWTLVSPEDPERRWGVIRVKAPKGNRRKNLYHWLYEENDYRIAGSGNDETFRLCPHVYNTEADILKAVRGMNAWFGSA